MLEFIIALALSFVLFLGLGLLITKFLEWLTYDNQ